MIPSFLYRLAARDEQNVPIRHASGRNFQSATLTNLLVSLRPSNNRELLLPSSIRIAIAAGAGQTVTGFSLYIANIVGGQVVGTIDAETNMTGQRHYRTYRGFDGLMAIDSREEALYLGASFSAAVLANDISLDVIGMVIPCGNVGDSRLLGGTDV